MSIIERGTNAASIALRERGFSRACPINQSQMDRDQAELERIVPRSTRLSWLLLDYEAGYPWEPCHRLVIWQMAPPTRTVWKFDAAGQRHLVDELNMPRDVWEVLQGPSPMSEGHACFDGWCDCEVKHQRWVGGPAIPGVDLRAWELFRMHGCLGKRWWSIQGSNGGHRFALNSKEKRILKFSTGFDAEVPALGSLPFAPFDNRVLAHIRGQDKLWAWQQKMGRDFESRTAMDVQADKDALAREGAELLVAHLRDQTDMWLRETAAPWLKEVQERSSWSQEVTPIDEEAVHRKFIETAT